VPDDAILLGDNPAPYFAGDPNLPNDERIVMKDASGRHTFDLSALQGYDGTSSSIPSDALFKSGFANRGYEHGLSMKDLAQRGWVGSDDVGRFRVATVTNYNQGAPGKFQVQTSTVPTFGYDGMLSLQELGGYLAGRRIYEPLSGVFMTQDPAQADANPYRWGHDDPVNEEDTSGLTASTFVNNFTLQGNAWNITGAPSGFDFSAPAPLSIQFAMAGPAVADYDPQPLLREYKEARSASMNATLQDSNEMPLQPGLAQLYDRAQLFMDDPEQWKYATAQLALSVGRLYADVVYSLNAPRGPQSLDMGEKAGAVEAGLQTVAHTAELPQRTGNFLFWGLTGYSDPAELDSFNYPLSTGIQNGFDMLSIAYDQRAFNTGRLAGKVAFQAGALAVSVADPAIALADGEVEVASAGSEVLEDIPLTIRPGVSTWVEDNPVEAEGIIYRRTNPITGRNYIGQAKNEFDYLARQRTHDRALNVRHDYEILQRVPNDKLSLDLAEETQIRLNGGPKRWGGVLENLKYQMNDQRYRILGGTVARPTVKPK
jgi:RHS repeat-associated protein